ncbi:hypothetical protein A2U01_0026338, partial [Trifolium medium]|nr:hypothetical protein [Trifolium medium]
LGIHGRGVTLEALAKVKKVKLQAPRRQYEHVEMEEQEKVEDFFNGVRVITNSMAQNVCTIEETKDVATMTPAELLSTLQARELRFNERSGDKDSDQALFAHSKKKVAMARNNGQRTRIKRSKKGQREMTKLNPQINEES